MGHLPHTGKVFGCPDNQARCRCDGIEAVLPVLVHPSRLDHGWDTLGREASRSGTRHFGKVLDDETLPTTMDR